MTDKGYGKKAASTLDFGRRRFRLGQVLERVVKMGVTTGSEVVGALEKAAQELQSLLRDSGKEIDTAGKNFQDLASRTDAILKLAAGVIACVEDEGVSSILSKVQTLGDAARQFIQERLRGTAGILEIVTAEARSLGRLSQLTRSQHSIARETQMLSVLTNIEVASLGQAGAGFGYLARQLDDFSQSVAKDTKELTGQTDERKAETEETRRMLAIELPRMREEFARIEADLADALAAVDSGLTELAGTPARFRGCVEEIAGQIAGVVAAVQAHDITRQQIEHVCEALRLISGKAGGIDGGQPGTESPLPLISAGLLIQSYQLKSIRATVSDWVSQIRSCTDGIVRISSSEVQGIGPVVLEQEQGLSRQLTRIDALEQECQADTEEVESTLGALTTLMQMVSKHLERARQVRDRLQLLTFNSIIEASRLGTQADAILEISQSIKRISALWSEMTGQSGQAKEEILSLTEKARDGMEAFSQNGKNGLRDAQAETRAGLENLRAAAAFASRQATEIEASIGELQVKIAAAGSTADRLDASFTCIDAVLNQIEALRRNFESDATPTLGSGEQAEMEAIFSAHYTTEMEREVLRAALAGGPLPQAQQNLAGNDVELF